ncbi:MAG: hypothetical protein DRQ40_03045 [Gammaproteobacteria bacterium]|nr:MAG: hypothetical protein DRQ40_03045 [Gammaproteobacteria bacterium]
MTCRPTRDSGPFTSGEIPLPFTVRFDPSDINFSGFALAATMTNGDGTERTFVGTVDWEDELTGTVRVEFASDDLLLDADVEHEDRELQVWTGDGGTNLVATVLIKVPIDESVGTPPSI